MEILDEGKNFFTTHREQVHKTAKLGRYLGLRGSETTGVGGGAAAAFLRVASVGFVPGSVRSVDADLFDRAPVDPERADPDNNPRGFKTLNIVSFFLFSPFSSFSNEN